MQLNQTRPSNTLEVTNNICMRSKCGRHLLSIHTDHTYRLVFTWCLQMPFIWLKYGDKILRIILAVVINEPYRRTPVLLKDTFQSMPLRECCALWAVKQVGGTECMHSFHPVEWVICLHMNILIYLYIWGIISHAYVSRQMNAVCH